MFERFYFFAVSTPLEAQSKGTKPPTLGAQQNSFLQSFEVKAEREIKKRADWTKNRPHRHQRQHNSTSTKSSWCWLSSARCGRTREKSHLLTISHSVGLCVLCIQYTHHRTHCKWHALSSRFKFFTFSTLFLRSLSPESRRNCVQTTWHYKIKCKLNNSTGHAFTFLYFFALLLYFHTVQPDSLTGNRPMAVLRHWTLWKI